MSRIALGLLALAAFPAGLLAQSPAVQRIQPISATVRDAGTLHFPHGTWTRKTSSIALGADVLYDNTCSEGFVLPLSGDTVVDEGRIPGTSSPTSAVSRPGCATSYAIEGFQIAYCTDQTSATFLCAFYDDYTPCATVVGIPPVAAFPLTGLPGSRGFATFCWTVTVDVSSAPFVLGAGPTNPRFGFAISSPQTSFVQGPFLAGLPPACSHFDGTSWDPVVDLAERGTGMGTEDQYRVEGGPTTPGCYSFFGSPFASFWLELYGTTCAPDGSGQDAFCSDGVTGTHGCPCSGSQPVVPPVGCASSLGIGARLVGAGDPSLANDTVVLHGSQMPPSSSVLYVQGTLRHQAGVGQVFGDGLRCVGGQLVRLGTAASSASGASQFPAAGQPALSVLGGVAAVGTRTYQAWYRNVAPFCTTAPFNTTNGWEIFWGA